MSEAKSHEFPKLHNAIWSGVVGKGPDSEPPIGLDEMLDLTAAAEVDGVHFDGVDLMQVAPHVDIDASDDDLKRVVEKVQSRNLVIGTLAAPVWPPTGGGSAMGSADERKSFLEQVRKGCQMAKRFNELGVRPDGVVRIDSAVDPDDLVGGPWGKHGEDRRHVPRSLHHRGEDHGERLAAEGEICWGGMHGWKKMVDLLEQVDRKDVLGFHADMAHTLLYTLGYNAPAGPHPSRRTGAGTTPKSSTGPWRPSRSRSVRGRTLSTWPRTTPRSGARAPTTRPVATVSPTIPTASSTSRNTPATGCATRTGS